MTWLREPDYKVRSEPLEYCLIGATIPTTALKTPTANADIPNADGLYVWTNNKLPTISATSMGSVLQRTRSWPLGIKYTHTATNTRNSTKRRVRTGPPFRAATTSGDNVMGIGMPKTDPGSERSHSAVPGSVSSKTGVLTNMSNVKSQLEEVSSGTFGSLLMIVESLSSARFGPTSSSTLAVATDSSSTAIRLDSDSH